MNKTYVLDTNVLLSDPNAIQSFEENDIILPLVVLEELDRHKNRQDDVGSCARQVNRSLDAMRKNGSLISGVKTHGGGLLRVVSIDSEHMIKLPNDLDPKKVDNQLIAFMLAIKEKSAILVTRDINVRIKCDALNINCDDYRKIRVANTTQEFYRGVVIKETTLENINSFYENGRLDPPDDWDLLPNQIVIFKNEDDGQKSSGIGRYVYDKDEAYVKVIKKQEKIFGLAPRNKEQNFSLDLLLDPNVKLVTLIGPSGCGKTLIALAAGLHQHKHLGSTSKHLTTYQKLVVSRPVMPVGKDVGFLPGTLQEKMEPWLAPIRDNLQFLMSTNKNGESKQMFPAKYGSKGQRLDPYFSLLMEKGDLEMEAISYIRGRSIPNSFIVIDEAQNLSIHELKTIITRVGENTKIVLTGDVDQIDNTNVDIFTNGLTYAIEKFKYSAIAGHVTLVKGERSELATEASRIL